MPSAAVIIIGDELLTGKFADQNGVYLIGRLRTLGCELHRLVFVQDDAQAIAEEVARCSALADHVVTSGGVGPTHDDITLESVAQAFGVPTVLHPELLALIDTFGLARTPATLRMATVPEGTTLIHSELTGYPVLRVRNVWVLPGIPSLFRAKFESIAVEFAGVPVSTARLYVDAHETDFADLLTELVAAHPEVSVGSYPRSRAEGYRVILTLESRSGLALEAARLALAAALPTVAKPDGT